MLNKFFKIRDYILKKRSIHIKIGRFDILANRAHSLKRILNKRPDYAENLPKMVRGVMDKYPDMMLLDIGANIGDTVALLRNTIECPIVCIEGDEFYYKYLKKNVSQFSNVKIFNTYLGNKQESLNIQKELALGTLSINSNKIGENLIKIERLDDFLKKNSLDENKIKFIKIDTDGFDTKIIEGGFNILKNKAPILFFEFDRYFLSREGVNGMTIFPFLSELGYIKVLFFDNIGRFLISVGIDDTEKLSQLYHYTYKKEGAFPFYDLCVFHQNDQDLASLLIKNELEG